LAQLNRLLHDGYFCFDPECKVLLFCLEKDAEHWVLHGGCLNEVGNLYGGSKMVARVGEAIKKRMVLERMEED
jgi:hypothetical protein